MGNRSRALVIALGIFFVGIAALAKFYAYPTLAVAPADQTAQTVSAGPDATIFSIADLQEKSGVTLEARRTVRGDVAAAEKISKKLDRKVVVFDTAVVTDDSLDYKFPDSATKTAEMPLSFVQERVVLDARTGESVRWAGENEQDNSGEYITTTLEKKDRLAPKDGDPYFQGHKGLVLKFPFGTEKKTYQFWDTSTRQAFPIKFDSEDKLYGLKVFKFVQDVPQQDIPQVNPLMVPPSVIKETGTAALEVKRTYQNKRTLWIEPVTGAIIKGQEEQLASLSYNGEPRVTATKVLIKYDDATVKKNVDGVKGSDEGNYKAKAAQLQLIGFWVPLISLIVGLLLLALVVFLSARPRRTVAVENDSAEV